MCPAAAVKAVSSTSEGGLGVSLLLGTDYEKKKKILQQELQLDYKNFVAAKKDQKTSEPCPQPQGLFLPVDEKIWIQKKLKEERNREYNLFLQQQAQFRRLKKRRTSITLKPGQLQISDPMGISVHNNHTHTQPLPRERPASRRDAATLTEAMDNGLRGQGHQGRSRWQIHRLKETYSSVGEQSTDREEELKFRNRRRQDRYSPEPEQKEGRKTREHRIERATQDTKAVEALGVHVHDNHEWVGKSDLQMPDNMRRAASSRSANGKERAEFASGLMIGATEEQAASQLKKEKYKQELLKQIAEQQRNKSQEKKLELGVAATEATAPEKEFGTVNQKHDSGRGDVPYNPTRDLEAVGKDLNPRQKDVTPAEDTEQRAPVGRFPRDYSTARGQLTGQTAPCSETGEEKSVLSLGYVNEDYHRDFSNMLGDVTIPRIAGVPPPVPPTVTNYYKTPYDAAYYYYGARNPLYPNLPYNHNVLPEEVQQSGNFQGISQRPPPFRPSSCTEATEQHGLSPPFIGELSADKAKQRRESVLSYKEALREQIKEREVRKKREKEEKEQYDAKIAAEMMAYNPWGKSGGGAPIRDQNGNIVNDLNQMHRINNESYRNPVSRHSGQTQSFLMKNENAAGVEARSPLSHQISGNNNNQPTTQQLHMQDRYQEDLKRQIKENKQKQEEERERMRIEEEKSEERVADQRARMQQEYMEEKWKQKKVKTNLETQTELHEPKTKHQEEEKQARQHREIEKRVPRSTGVRLKKSKRLNHEREPSPPIPTLGRKQTNLITSRPSTVVSQLSHRTEHSMSAPHCQPVPAKIPQLQDGQQEVIRELSALRRCLRKEQRRLEVQLDQTDPQESHYTPPNRYSSASPLNSRGTLSRPRGRPRVDAFKSAHKQAVQAPTRRPHFDAAHANMQNIREFNQLKYRDTASREKVRHMYPDPPTDAQNLDIQHQALLREQQRKIRLMKREQECDFLDQQLIHCHSTSKSGHHIDGDFKLPSETTFIEVYSGDACEKHVQEQRYPQHSAKHRERTARRHYCDPDTQTLTGLNLESEVRPHSPNCITTHDHGGYNSRSEWLPDNEDDVLSLHSALERRLSMDTVATEPWLRPGTSNAVQCPDSRETPNSRMEAPPWLSHRIA